VNIITINDRITPDSNADTNAAINPCRTVIAKTTINIPEIAIDSGKMVVTVATTSGVCVKPIKKSDKNAVEGRPPMNTASLLLNFNPKATEKKFHRVPARKASANCNGKKCLII